MTRVLLTGAGGFVGSHVLECLIADTSWKIVVVDSFRHNGAQDRIFEVVQDAGAFEQVDLLAHDLTVPFSPRERVAVGRPDYILSIAAGCSVPDSIEHPADFVRNNVEITLTMLELARQVWTWQGHDVRAAPHRLVHLSTDEVYGPSVGATDHRPSSPYAASKAAQEDLVHAWATTYAIPITVVSSANMFGERQSQLAYIPRVIRAVLNNESLPIHTWHGVPGRRQYSYVRNVAQHIADVVTSDEHRTISGTGVDREPLKGQYEINNLDLAERIAGLIGRPLRYSLVDGSTARPGYDPAYPDLAGDPAWAALSFTDGLERTVKWYVDHPDWLAQ